MVDGWAEGLRGKVAFIRGAGGGMGREAAVLFAEEGARVVVADIDGAAAAETVNKLEAAGGQGLAVTGDVAVEADVQRMIADGVRKFGALHVLYNNAGVLWKDRDRSVLETDEKWWDRVMAINLKSVFWVTKHGIPQLQKAGGGSIIMMGSVSALAGFTRGGGWRPSPARRPRRSRGWRGWTRCSASPRPPSSRCCSSSSSGRGCACSR